MALNIAYLTAETENKPKTSISNSAIGLYKIAL
jgi:NAD dependent epimerase/dehydratase family enzyme